MVYLESTLSHWREVEREMEILNAYGIGDRGGPIWVASEITEGIHMDKTGVINVDDGGLGEAGYKR